MHFKAMQSIETSKGVSDGEGFGGPWKILEGSGLHLQVVDLPTNSLPNREREANSELNFT